MSPECLYWVALLLLVLPSAPFNKVAWPVLGVWAFGHFAHMSSQYENVAYMFASIVAIGAALAVSHPWDGSRRALAHVTANALFFCSALLGAYSAIYFDHDPANMTEWTQQNNIYWLWWSVLMLQAIAIPVGNDWHRIKELAKRLDADLWRKIDKQFNGVQ